MNDELLSRFKGDMSFIQNPENYYAIFIRVIETCATAQLENLLFYNEDKISDAEYQYNVCRIQEVRTLAIKAHGEWTIKMLEQSKTQHTPRTFVSSVYSDIFGIELEER